MQPPKAENVNLGVQLALGGVVTAALVGAGAWLYLRRGHSEGRQQRKRKEVSSSGGLCFFFLLVSKKSFLCISAVKMLKN